MSALSLVALLLAPALAGTGALALAIVFLLSRSSPFMGLALSGPYFSDSVSDTLILLTLVLMGVTIIFQEESLNLARAPTPWMVLLTSLLVLSFGSTSLLSFYFLFEATLLPMLVILIGWGYQPERWGATLALVIYTMTLSLPLLVMLTATSTSSSSEMALSFLALGTLPSPAMVVAVAVGAFLVKCPMYSFHLWLPKAHVEAPVGGSMVLAAILLKLGGFGILRVSSVWGALNFSSGLQGFSLAGGLVASALCLTQTDTKVLIAYSSVGHMSLCIACLFALSEPAMAAGMVIMAAHGASSCAMFAMAGALYSFSGTRSMAISKGVLLVCPSLAVAWFITLMGSISAPPTINLLGEVLAFMALMANSLMVATPLFIMAVVTMAYSLGLYISPMHGKGVTQNSCQSVDQAALEPSIFLILAPLVAGAALWV